MLLNVPANEELISKRALIHIFVEIKLLVEYDKVLFESIRCNMVILKKGYFLRTMEIGFRPFWNETFQIHNGACYPLIFFS